jgi:hypothetical protein
MYVGGNEQKTKGWMRESNGEGGSGGGGGRL